MVSKIILGFGLFAALFAILIFSGKINLGKTVSTPSGEVTMWGTFSEEKMNRFIQNFNIEAKTYKINYVEVSESSFDQRLLEALASGTGPDLILAPYQTILAQASRISPYQINEKTFKDRFFDGSFLLHTPSGALALPVSIDPMVLFYNRTLLSKHGIANPPKDWNEVMSMVQNITILNDRKQFIESGIALGTPNTPYAKDILMTIVAQLGQKPVLKTYNGDGMSVRSMTANKPIIEDGDVFPLATTLRFFTHFADPLSVLYSWNQSSGNAEDVFLAEKLAMYIGYYSDFVSFRARNPRAEIEMTTLPQSKGYYTNVTGMRMYAVATLSKTRNYSVSKYVQEMLSYGKHADSLAVIIGGVPAYKDYLKKEGLNPVATSSILIARGWEDVYFKKSSELVSLMISDVISNRQDVTSAASIFVSRMQDIYTPIK
ncbi:MAG: carbohydrate ABC transporter substrate-binding protein [Candidatus Pacebacteria bacterium]|nr:carbohydrate ABC transporter substrate-binding protein [Candidatus Paceibacterota bacterium]MBP9866487.1 carbohydrate ABC transporter substrate-binding protein [Candidatus Paceibacterota bacterium]